MGVTEGDPAVMGEIFGGRILLGQESLHVGKGVTEGGLEGAKYNPITHVRKGLERGKYNSK